MAKLLIFRLMKYITIVIFLFPGVCLSQMTRTSTKDFGKVGKLKFQLSTSITNSDTVKVYVISENASMFYANLGKAVMIKEDVLPEIIEVLKSFVPEVKQKNPSNGSSITYRTKDSSLVASCMYVKIDGWTISIMNTDKNLEQALEKIENKTGYSFNQFVIIDPYKLEPVIKLLTKIMVGER